MNDDVAYILAFPAWMGPGAAAVPGSVRFPCAKCQAPVWMSPFSQGLLRDGAIPLCVLCAPIESREIMVTEEQRQEVERALNQPIPMEEYRELVSKMLEELLRLRDARTSSAEEVIRDAFS